MILFFNSDVVTSFVVLCYFETFLLSKSFGTHQRDALPTELVADLPDDFGDTGGDRGRGLVEAAFVFPRPLSPDDRITDGEAKSHGPQARHLDAHRSHFLFSQQGSTEPFFPLLQKPNQAFKRLAGGCLAVAIGRSLLTSGAWCVGSEGRGRADQKGGQASALIVWRG